MHWLNDVLKVSKFDQIASKFDQIPPKSLDAFHHTVQPEIHHTTTNTSSSLSSSSTSSSAQSTSFTDTTVPNLRIDYFAESKLNDTLDDSQKLTHNNPGAINVTSNPMDTPVCTQPRATIVVQQVRVNFHLKNFLSNRKVLHPEKFVSELFLLLFLCFEIVKRKRKHFFFSRMKVEFLIYFPFQKNSAKGKIISCMKIDGNCFMIKFNCLTYIRVNATGKDDFIVLIETDKQTNKKGRRTKKTWNTLLSVSLSRWASFKQNIFYLLTMVFLLWNKNTIRNCIGSI